VKKATVLRAATFDFWGTLYQPAFGRNERLCLLQAVLERHGQQRPWTDLEAAYEHAWDVFDRLWREEHRSITTDHWLREVLSFLDARLPEGALADLHRPLEEVFLHGDAPRPVPGVTEVIPRLSRRYRLGVISDVGLTPGRVLRQILRRDGLLPHLSALTFSDKVGVTKPLPRPFLHTLSALGVRPEEAVHVGDLPETDLSGARAVGMRAVLFLGVSHREDGRPLADAVFAAYDELEDLLERMNEVDGH
jgi:putative hydrolase of the HAD superfamily